jgi:hypothetical protein
MIGAMEELNPIIKALLAFLAEWEAAQRIELGWILTAGRLEDVQELDRMYALGEYG